MLAAYLYILFSHRKIRRNPPIGFPVHGSIWVARLSVVDFVPIHNNPMPAMFSFWHMELPNPKGRTRHFSTTIRTLESEGSKCLDKMVGASPASAVDEFLGLFQRYSSYHRHCYVAATASLRFLFYPRSHTSVFLFFYRADKCGILDSICQHKPIHFHKLNK